MQRPPLTLEPEELRRLGHRVVDALVEHAERLGELAPQTIGTPAELRERLGGPAPDAPGDPDAALDTLLRDVLPFMQHGDHPRYFARVPSPSNPVAALGDALASGFNAIATSWAGGSGPAALELVVLDWLREWCGLPAGTEGILLSGGSIASLTALAAAREASPPGAVAYCSDQTHASLPRALRLLGFTDDRIRVLPSGEDFRLAVDTVAAAVADDERPGIIIANAGTTNTGAIDPLPQLADLAAQHGLWFHVDGAYGAPGTLTERGHAALAGIERADSLVLDPHKWLFQPYEIGSVLVRRPGALQRAFAMFPEYLRDVGASDDEEVAFRDRGPQLTRGSRALKLWLSVQVFGLDAFRSAIDRGIDLAERAQQLVAATPGFEIVTPASLGIVTFRFSGAPESELDARNARLAEDVVRDGYAVPSSTVLRGRTVLRLCTINPRTTDEELERTVARIAQLAAAAG
ncbi:MAG: gadB [Solirubrobacteraceae bacterium]|nr:gadB [Solirubrobacteraceae bacterium]